MTAPSSAPVAQMLRMVRPVPPYWFRNPDGVSHICVPAADAQFQHRQVCDPFPGANLAVLHAMGAMQKVCAEFRGRV